MGAAMQCMHCLEEIIEGASICRFCGRKQRSVQQRKLLLFVALPLGALVILMTLAQSDYESQQRDLNAAAICNGSLTADQIKSAAQKAAAESNISIRDAQRYAIAFACPSMAK